MCLCSEFLQRATTTCHDCCVFFPSAARRRRHPSSTYSDAVILALPGAVGLLRRPAPPNSAAPCHRSRLCAVHRGARPSVEARCCAKIIEITARAPPLPILRFALRRRSFARLIIASMVYISRWEFTLRTSIFPLPSRHASQSRFSWPTPVRCTTHSLAYDHAVTSG